MKWSQTKRVFVAIGGLAGLAVFSAIPGAEIRASQGGVVQQAPAHLDILAAGIQEVARDYNFHQRDDVPTRQVLLTFTVAGPPTCDATTGFLGYCFLIDKDRDPGTGVTNPVLDDLGIDARMCATCDPASSSFTSPLGPVTVTTDPATGETTIEILTTAAMLPSVEFDWIAFAEHDSVFCRVPAIPDHESWMIFERMWE